MLKNNICSLQESSEEFLVGECLEAVIRRCSSKQVFLKFSQNKKTPVLASLFNEVAGLRACCFMKKRLQQNCFLVKYVTSLRTPVFTEHLQ